MTDLAALRTLAEKATPEAKGRWKYHRSIFPDDPVNYTYVEWGEADRGYGTGTLSQTMGRYIAAVSPDRVLALISEVESLRAVRDAARRVVKEAEPDDFAGEYEEYLVPAEAIDGLRVATEPTEREAGL